MLILAWKTGVARQELTYGRVMLHAVSKHTQNKKPMQRELWGKHV
jgi:hypothetical protein